MSLVLTRAFSSSASNVRNGTFSGTIQVTIASSLVSNRVREQPRSAFFETDFR
jgi:hypothetical protein